MKNPRFTLRGFKRPREAVIQTLGALEREVMEVVWRHGGEVSVREVYAAIGERVAYTTVMTTLNRLHRKGLLRQRRTVREYYYSARVSHEQFEQSIARELIGGLLNQTATGTAPVLACIVEAVSDHDQELLDELERLVQEKKRQKQEAK